MSTNVQKFLIEEIYKQLRDWTIVRWSSKQTNKLKEAALVI
jgi:hypothetical protein